MGPNGQIKIPVGIETCNGFMTEVVTRYSKIPTKKSQIFSTAANYLNTVTIQVYKGESAMIKDNHKIGQLDLAGILPAPRGDPQIEVTIEIDTNGIMIVSAEDKGTGNKEKITITNDNNRLSAEDIKRMINDAKKKKKEFMKVSQKKVDKILTPPPPTIDIIGSRVIVLHLAKGSQDTSLLHICNGQFIVLSRNHNTNCVGEHFNQRVIGHLIKLYKEKKGKYLRKDVRAVKRLCVDLDNGNRLSELLTQAKFEELNMDLFKETLKAIQKVLEDAKLTKKDIEEIVLVGKSTRIPKIQQLIKEYFELEVEEEEPSMAINQFVLSRIFATKLHPAPYGPIWALSFLPLP